jgi:hypothetical protein
VKPTKALPIPIPAPTNTSHIEDVSTRLRMRRVSACSGHECELVIHETLKKAGTICPYVFHRERVRIVYFRAAWKNACKAAGCPGALVHDMRRSAVRTFERASEPRSVAMSIVGHKTEPIYRRYPIVGEAMQREAAVRLDACLAAPRAASTTATVAALRRASRSRSRTMQ